MKRYIFFNKDKLVRTYKWAAIILTIAFAAVEFDNCYHDDCSSKIRLTYGLIMTLIVVPTSLLISDIVPGYLGYRNTNRFFETSSVNGLLQTGFKKDWDNKDSKWFLSNLIAVGNFDRYQMICEVEGARLRIIAKSKYDHLDNWDIDEIKAVQKQFSHVRFEYDGLGIATSLRMTQVKRMTFDELQTYLGEFAKMLKKLRIE